MGVFLLGHDLIYFNPATHVLKVSLTLLNEYKIPEKYLLFAARGLD
jgi:hypothetical protein